ncbi:MAG: prepilin-type N-terminal cleavage/methylation domain-containing protein [Thermogutta sp.]|nr:prepilin-type N-terminal cleavage/methylation domain-containing protein [Thermogutta sp.]
MKSRRGTADRLRRRASAGFTLLEVILAMTILMLSLAAVSQLVLTAHANARLARDRGTAQMLCDGLAAELIAGSLPLESTSETPLEDVVDGVDPGWLYAVDVSALDLEGLLRVEVVVRQDETVIARPAEARLVQWLIDPDYQFVQPGESAASGESSSSSSGSGSSSSESEATPSEEDAGGAQP